MEIIRTGEHFGTGTGGKHCCRMHFAKAPERIAIVTGGAGFVGSHLCDRLIDDGFKVICLDSFLTGRQVNIDHLNRDPRFELIEQDVIDLPPTSLIDGKVRFTHLFHLACAASPPQYQADPEHTMLTNVLGTRNMLRLAENCGARFLLTSTSEVYGDPEVHPQAEDYRGSVSCTGPRACYDVGKRAAETLAFDFLRGGRCDTRVARIFNTYGPRMRPDDGRVVSNVVCQAIAGAEITIYGDGLQTRSFCFVDDLVEGLVRLMHSESARGLPVNLGNPQERRVHELVDLVIRMTSSESRVTHMPLPQDDPKRRRPDIARAKALLDWSPTIDLEDGLSETIRWFRRDSMASEPRELVAAE